MAHNRLIVYNVFFKLDLKFEVHIIAGIIIYEGK